MSNQHDENEHKGRSWDQLTSGTSSAATMGAGATGDKGSSQAAAPAPDASPPQAGRTDDLLAGGSAQEQGDRGFQGQAGAQGSQAAAGTGKPPAGTRAGQAEPPERAAPEEP